MLETLNPTDDLTSVASAVRSSTFSHIIFGQILASWRIGPRLRSIAKLLELRELLVEQRGIEPLTSALRIRRSANS